jgi:hypothetical protein
LNDYFTIVCDDGNDDADVFSCIEVKLIVDDAVVDGKVVEAFDSIVV